MRPRNKPTRKESKWKTMVTVRLGVCILLRLQVDVVVVLVCVVVLRRGRRGEVPDYYHERQNTQGNVDDQGQPQRELLAFHVSGYRVWSLGFKPYSPFRGSFSGSARSLSPPLQPPAGCSIGHTAWPSSHE
jgi:hypothetical protein